MRQKLTACLLPAIFACLILHAQTNGFNTADTLAMHFVKNIRNASKEKILLETDRKVYAAGEKIWFNAYLLRSLNNRLDTTSRNLFVDLVDDSDKIIKQLVLNVYSLHTDGVITLSDSLPTGYYWLRAYTQHISSTDSAAIRLQPLYIKNLVNSTEFNMPYKATAKLSAQTVIDYFPEGGALIAGISSTGALQVKDGNGKPLMVTGTITDAGDSVITNFTTNRFGLARITFYPVWYKKYFAVINVNAHQLKYPLTEWSPFAAQLAVARQTNDFIQAYVTLEDSVYSRKYTSYVLGLSADSVCFASVGRGMYQLDIPVSALPGGVATLLLFDGNERLLSERKVFINKNNYTINITADKPNYTARDKARVNIDVTGPEGKPLVASLNVSVQDDRLMAMSDEIKNDTIYPAGVAELNDWLKHNKSSFTAEEIDLFMLAQKATFTNWQKQAANLPAYNDETSLLKNLTGTVVNKRIQPLKGKIVTAISLTGINPYLALDTTNNAGGFQLPLPANRDTLLLKVQVKNRRDNVENDSIIINNFPFPNFKTPQALKQGFALAKQVFTQRMATHHIDTVFIGVGKGWLKPVIVKASIKPKAEVDYDKSKRLSSFSYILSGDKLGKGGYGQLGNTMLMVPGLSLKNGRLVLYGGAMGMGEADSGGGGNKEPLIVMDGIRIPSSTLTQDLSGGSAVMSFLNSLDYRTVDFIEVLNGADAAIYGNDGGNGVIVINTLSRPKDGAPEAFTIIRPLTYHTAPKFVMPDYAVKQVKNSKAPDPRITIYWKSNLLTGIDGKAYVEFYTADEASTYSVVVSGITANGEYVYKRISLNRK